MGSPFKSHPDETSADVFQFRANSRGRKQMHADVNGRGFLFVRQEGTVALGQRGHSPSSHMVSLGLFVAQSLPAVSSGSLSHQHDRVSSCVTCGSQLPTAAGFCKMRGAVRSIMGGS